MVDFTWIYRVISIPFILVSNINIKLNTDRLPYLAILVVHGDFMLPSVLSLRY